MKKKLMAFLFFSASSLAGSNATFDKLAEICDRVRDDQRRERLTIAEFSDLLDQLNTAIDLRHTRKEALFLPVGGS